MHRRIKDAARANHRSVNGEILFRLAASVSELTPAEAAIPAPYAPIREEELLERGGRLRERIDARGGINIRQEDIRAMIEEGRP